MDSKYAGHYAFRRKLVTELQRDLLGPFGGDEEILTDAPIDTYITGVLFPRRRDRDAEREQQAELDIDLASVELAVDEIPDTGVSLANVRKPSSMGLTFAVDPLKAGKVLVTLRAARYEAIDAEGNVVEAKRAERRATAHDIRWRRRPLSIDPIPVDVMSQGSFSTSRSPLMPATQLSDGLELRVRVREPHEGAVAVTVTLVNVHEIGIYDLQDAHAFFQPCIEVSVPGGAAALVERPVPVGSDEDEVLLTKLLHRHAPTFAVGHGCAADWTWKAPHFRGAVEELTGPKVVPAVWTTFVPTFEVMLADSNPEFDIPDLDMLHLASAADDQVVASLHGLVRGYRVWIDERATEAILLDSTEYAKVAHTQIRICAETADRIERGIDLLSSDPDTLNAFRLANKAMARQRGRTEWLKGGCTGVVRDQGRWRPFQIAFILLCLRGIVDPEHEERSIADLLWFPTGGGKTEAYLGLIAFTVFRRRIRLGDDGGGVTALMRYTLRLLTLQQFERAATLICAMELMREHRTPVLGSEKISLGMWVGRAATPNTLQEAASSLKSLRNGKELQEKNPVQLRACPWCGTVLDAYNYEVSSDLSTMSVCCPGDCEFSSGLPVHVVDEMIYAERPTLIIATADKFAQIAWRDNPAALFNRDRTEDSTPPPELVVQDELHLISGPLGTLSGLYESAIDIAAGRPKIIASTATIRRAKDQGQALFDRVVHQFPPPGLDARDSWFAVEAPPKEKASRLYVGLMTPATSQATLLVRAYAALLHHANAISGAQSVRDAYWTLVGYFNSLRILAAAELQVNDDVEDRLQLLSDRASEEARTAEFNTELTSRVKSSEIPKRLKQLEKALPDEPYDTVLATNMISVGVDVDRLGLMAVMGQPQTTAEYIQSTSRVGRKHPGLVVTLFNAARSRDRSHYEGFVSYHSALYRQVESTSVTPFSPRARDRALHAVLIGLTRLMEPDARSNGAASGIGTYVDRVEALKELIVARAKNVEPEEASGTETDLDEVIEHWLTMAEENEDLVYEAPPRRAGPRGAFVALLKTHGEDDLEHGLPTLWSLRDVDVESDLYVER